MHSYAYLSESALKLDHLGWCATESWTPADPELFPARVSSQHRGSLDILSTHGESRAMLRGNLIDDPPVVGDWVAARRIGDQALIESILPRRTTLHRRRVNGGRPQILAANIDCVAAVTAMDRDFNPRRLERYEAAARGAGCEVRVILTKADQVEDLTPFLEALREPPIVISSITGHGIDEVRNWIDGRTMTVVGTSGVGKSTLINALLGADVQATGPVSDKHGKGRHTTTTRELRVLPGGGCVIDTPGMREFGLADDADASTVFDDIAALAEECRFRDCQHVDEPGCNVLEAVATGAISPGRVASYQKLGRELAYERRRTDKRAAAEQRRAWTRKIRAVQNLKKDRGY